MFKENKHNKTINIRNLRKKSSIELIKIAKYCFLKNINYLSNYNLIFFILKYNYHNNIIIVDEGILEIMYGGYGFLRSKEYNYSPSINDIYVSPNQIKKFGLKTGNLIKGIIKPPKKEEYYFILVNIYSVNELCINNFFNNIFFDHLTPIYPKEQIFLELNKIKNNLIGRIIDLISPLGKGQRALIVAPPKSGKTVLMQNIAYSINKNYPSIHLILLSIGERPEEVTDMERSIKGDVVSSTFDEPSYRHIQLTELIIEKSKRMIEHKKNVVILLDSITRLARAYNDITPSSGRTLSGGIDFQALQRPKKIFGSARNIENGGSLTIIATALINTGSRMDEVIFEEFKGTGNSEIVLNKKIADRRIFPAIDIKKSGTRKEELLFEKKNISKFWLIRKILNPMKSIEALEFLMNKLKLTTSNNNFFFRINK